MKKLVLCLVALATTIGWGQEPQVSPPVPDKSAFDQALEQTRKEFHAAIETARQEAVEKAAVYNRAAARHADSATKSAKSAKDSEQTVKRSETAALGAIQVEGQNQRGEFAKLVEAKRKELTDQGVAEGVKLDDYVGKLKRTVINPGVESVREGVAEGRQILAATQAASNQTIGASAVAVLMILALVWFVRKVFGREVVTTDAIPESVRKTWTEVFQEEQKRVEAEAKAVETDARQAVTAAQAAVTTLEALTVPDGNKLEFQRELKQAKQALAAAEQKFGRGQHGAALGSANTILGENGLAERARKVATKTGDSSAASATA